jgi:hypothetical protein
MSETETPKRKRRSGSETRQKQHWKSFRLSAEENTQLVEYADRAGLTVGSYIRGAVLQKPKTRQMRKPPFDRVLLAQTMGQIQKAGVNLHQLVKHLNFGGMPEAETEYKAALIDFRASISALMVALGKKPLGSA